MHQGRTPRSRREAGAPVHHKAETTHAPTAVTSGTSNAHDNTNDAPAVAILFAALAALAMARLARRQPTIDVSLELPTLRMLAELALCAGVASTVNVAIALLVRSRLAAARPALCASLLVLTLALPYLVPAHLVHHALPLISAALALWVGVWKGLGALGGTRELATSSSPLVELVYFVCMVDFRCGAALPERASDRSMYLRTLREHAATTCWHGLALSSLASLIKMANALDLGAGITVLRLYAQVWLVFLFLSFNADAQMVGISLLGYVPRIAFRDPLTRGASPSDFWGRRWNLIIHRLFVRSIFRPLVSRGMAPAAGAAIAFLVSGLFHEYAFMAPPAARAAASVGRCLAFFLLQAPVISAEKVLESAAGAAADSFGIKLSSSGGGILKTAVVTSCLLPLAPLFMAPLEASGALREMTLLVPSIIVG